MCALKVNPLLNGSFKIKMGFDKRARFQLFPLQHRKQTLSIQVEDTEAAAVLRSILFINYRSACQHRFFPFPKSLTIFNCFLRLIVLVLAGSKMF